jgi:hypothetical protein
LGVPLPLVIVSDTLDATAATEEEEQKEKEKEKGWNKNGGNTAITNNNNRNNNKKAKKVVVPRLSYELEERLARFYTKVKVQKIKDVPRIAEKYRRGGYSSGLAQNSAVAAASAAVEAGSGGGDSERRSAESRISADWGGKDLDLELKRVDGQGLDNIYPLGFGGV